MRLTADLFQHIIQTLSSDEGSCSRHEKRTEGRVGMRCSVNIIPQVFTDNGPQTMSVVVKDISASGMGFVAREQIPAGTKLVCPLPCEDNTTIGVAMVVRHCVRMSKDQYGIGVSFDPAQLKFKPKGKKSAGPDKKRADKTPAETTPAETTPAVPPVAAQLVTA